MDLNEARNLLPQFADGELDEPRRAELAAAIERSPELREELTRWRALRSCCCRCTCEPVPVDLGRRVSDRLRQAAPSSRSRLIRLWPAAAAAAVLMAGTWLGRDYLPVGAGLPGEQRAYAGSIDSGTLAGLYRHCALNHHDTYDVASHPDRLSYVRAELQRRADIPPALVPDLSDAGFQVDGCCNCVEHVAGIKNLKSAHVFYREPAGQHRVVSFFVITPCVKLAGGRACDKSDAGRYEAVTADGDIVLVQWRCKKRTYAVAGQMPPAELRSLARRMDVTLHPVAPLFAFAD